MIFFGIAGYLMRKFEFEAAPFILAVVLGPMMEKACRQSLIMSRGDFSIFVTRPIPAVIFAIAAFLLVLPMFSKTRQEKIATLKDD